MGRSPKLLSRAVLLGALSVAAAACTAVLGLDAPTLDPCASAPCVDAADAGAGDVTADTIGDVASDVADADAAHRDADAADVAIVGVRCGGGSFAESGCNGATPVCCQTTDGGVTSYACVASSAACAGYPIGCATNNDCTGTDVCCHYMSSIKCEPTTATCANQDLVCEPSGPVDQCPAGWHCTAMVTNAGVASPYYACAP